MGCISKPMIRRLTILINSSPHPPFTTKLDKGGPQKTINDNQYSGVAKAWKACGC